MKTRYRISVYLSAEEYERVTAFAEEHYHRRLSDIAYRALMAHINRYSAQKHARKAEDG